MTEPDSKEFASVRDDRRHDSLAEVGAKHSRDSGEGSGSARGEKRIRKSVERLKSSSLRTADQKPSSPRPAPSPRADPAPVNPSGASAENAVGTKRLSKGGTAEDKQPTQSGNAKRQSSSGKPDLQKTAAAESGARGPRAVPEDAVRKVFSPTAKTLPAKTKADDRGGLEGNSPQSGGKRAAVQPARDEEPAPKSGRTSSAGTADNQSAGKRSSKAPSDRGDAEGGSPWLESQARWSRPVKDEGMGGEWMVGRHVQVWQESTSQWRVGKVVSFDAGGKDASGEPGRMHRVLYGDEDPVLQNFSTLRWKLDRREDSDLNPKTFKLHDIPDRDQIIQEAKPAPHLKKRLKGRPRSPVIVPQAEEAAAEIAQQQEIPAKAFGMASAADQLQAKQELVFDALDAVKVHVQCKGARFDGELAVDDGELRVLMGDDSGRTMTLAEFAELGKASGAQAQGPKELIEISSTGDTLAGYETTLSGYGRQKIVDGTKVRMMFDEADWYQGQITAYHARSGRYTVLFQDGEEVLARHALFEKDGFFLDNDRDCGLSFKVQALQPPAPALKSPPPQPKPPAPPKAAKPEAPPQTKGESASPAKKSAEITGKSTKERENGAEQPKSNWRLPNDDERAGGEWLVGRRVNVYFEEYKRYKTAQVTAVRMSPSKAPVHTLVYVRAPPVQA